MPQRKILIAEDTVDLSDMMRNFLLKEGFTVYQAFDGMQAVEMARKIKPDLLLLDIMMPILDGYQVCANLRVDMNIPIIVISAKVGEDDKLRLFDLGADDYITKPFSLKEMVWRVKAQMRRSYELNKTVEGERYHGKLKISPERFEARVDGEIIALTAKEFKMLDFMSFNSNSIFSKQKLIDNVWGIDEYIDENTVAVTVARLREKLSKHGIDNITTIWGLGYKWQE
jgi:DNA-binding response OmpR family regulator